MRFVILLGFAALACTNKPMESNHSTAEKAELMQPSSKSSMDTTARLLDFNADIKPIFQAQCSPCHFPGGKMYARLPFDSARTIIEQSEGILRRIKDTEENESIKKFISQSQKISVSDSGKN